MGEETVEHELTLLITPVCSSFSFTLQLFFFHLVSMEFPSPHPPHSPSHRSCLPVLELCRYRFENGWKSFFMSLTWPIRPVFHPRSQSASQWAQQTGLYYTTRFNIFAPSGLQGPRSGCGEGQRMCGWVGSTLFCRDRSKSGQREKRVSKTKGKDTMKKVNFLGYSSKNVCLPRV